MTAEGNSSLRRRNAKRARNSIPLLLLSEPEAIVTLEKVNALRDELAVMDEPSDRPSNLR